MTTLRKSSKRYNFRHIIACFLACCIFFNTSVSVTLAKPKGAHGGNPHSIQGGNPHGGVNPAGVIISSGGVRVNGAAASYGSNSTQPVHLIGKQVTNTGTILSPNGYVVIATGGSVFIGQPAGNIFVKLHPAGHQIVRNKGTANPANGQIVLAAGDIFSGAMANLDSLASSLTIPDPIGAKGPNPAHGGGHANKGDGNPGGGNGKGHWGQGNKGNGVGNIWVGNQGRGVGEGMAGGRKPEPPAPPPDPPPVPPNGDNGGINTGGAAPLPQLIPPGVEQTQFEQEGGCPALMHWLAEELGIEQGSIQIYVTNSFALSTDIQPCETSAKLKDAAAILEDPNGTGIAALAQVVNEFVATAAPPSEEQMASIAMVLAEHADDETYYAAAGQWLDALAEYVGILNNEMGYSPDDSVAFADKYVAPVTETDEVSLIAYVEVSLAALGG